MIPWDYDRRKIFRVDLARRLDSLLPAVPLRPGLAYLQTLRPLCSVSQASVGEDFGDRSQSV